MNKKKINNYYYNNIEIRNRGKSTESILACARVFSPPRAVGSGSSRRSHPACTSARRRRRKGSLATTIGGGANIAAAGKKASRSGPLGTHSYPVALYAADVGFDFFSPALSLSLCIWLYFFYFPPSPRRINFRTRVHAVINAVRVASVDIITTYLYIILI